MSGSKAAVSACEINNARNEYERLRDQLANFRDWIQRNESELRDITDKEGKAQKLLGLTDNSLGFASERERASGVLEECKRRRALLEPKIKGLKETVKRLEQQIKKIDTSALTREKEIRDLAHELRGPW